MPFTKGKSANPNGRPKRGHAFSDQLRLVLSDDADHSLGAVKKGKTALRVVVEQLVKSALEGELQAIRDIADRVDGKPNQTIDQTVTDVRLSDFERLARIAELLERGGADRASDLAGARESGNGQAKPH